MKIERNGLVDDLLTFAVRGSGVIVGPPGVGKSYTLADLADKLKSKRIPHLVIPVERIGAATEAELTTLLGRTGDLISLLGAIEKEADVRGIIIFDGFDAARGQDERNGVFSLIARTTRELRDTWNTIVSVRTFDARKSERLLDLFSQGELRSGETKSCHRFEIPVLTTEEIEHAICQIAGLQNLYDQGSADFRQLLCTPFNLWLIEKVLASGARADEFSHVISEVQLLELYWRYRVRNADSPEDREFVLKSAAQKMVQSHTLSVRRDVLYKPEIRNAWDGLLSDEILSLADESNPIITFSHNILFDFSVSTHLLDPDPSLLANFVAEEPSRPLFLRPSLVYHFTSLWHFDRASYWRNFWAVLKRDEIHLRHIIRLVLPSVIVNEAIDLDDFRPIRDRLRSERDSGIEAVAFLLQAQKILKSPRVDLWSSFLRDLGPAIDQRFAWDAGNIASEIAHSSESPIVKSNCGSFARDLLKWSWNNCQQSEQPSWYERVTGILAIPLVVSTFETDSNASRKLLEDVISTLDRPNCSIDCIYRLTNEVGELIRLDAELVGDIYERVFSYDEQSEAETNFGGPVLPLRSNRRQDFDMCRYNLVQEFSNFIELSPSIAFKSGIRSIQSFILNDHVYPFLDSDKTLSDITFDFPFRNSTSQYIVDHSAIWDNASYPDQELQIADTLFEHLNRAAKGECRVPLEALLDTFGREAKLAFLWSRILSIATQSPQQLGLPLWELATRRPFYEQSDTIFALGNFLESCFAAFPVQQRTSIENVLLDLDGISDAEQRRFKARRRDQLLSRISTNFLTTEGAIVLRRKLEEEDRLLPKTPVFQISSSDWSPITDDELLGELLTSQSPDNLKLREMWAPLRAWHNEGAEESQIDNLLPAAYNLKRFLSDSQQSDQVHQDTASRYLAQFSCEALLKTSDYNASRFHTLRDLALHFANHSKPERDLELDSTWTTPSWSPEPRTEAAQALSWVMVFSRDEEALAAIKRLADDPVPSVRYLVAHDLWRLQKYSPDVMWTLLDSLVHHEANEVVLLGITHSIWKLIPRSPDESLTLIRALSRFTEVDPNNDSKIASALIFMITDYAIMHDNQWAKEVIAGWQNSPIECSGQLAMSGKRIIEYLKPQCEMSQFLKARSLMLEQLHSVAKGLTMLQLQADRLTTNDFQKKWKELYGVINDLVMRTYFAADVNQNLRQRSENPLDDTQRVEYFNNILPLLEIVLGFGSQKDTGMLLAPTAHHFMELLNGYLRHDPLLVLRMAADVISCSKTFGYNLDSMAMKETVQVVEKILADYRHLLQEDESVRNLLQILDAFVEAGWPEALNLVWRLDEIYR